MISPYASHLVMLLKGQVPKGLTELDWEKLLRISQRTSILAKIAHKLVSPDLLMLYPRFTDKHFNSAIKYAALQKQQVRFEATQLLTLLGPVCHTEIIFLKGAAYSLANYQVGLGRVFSDIDLLVSKSDLKTAENKLLVYGWFPETTDEYDQKYYREWAHEIPPLRHSHRGTLLDVHHNLVPIVSGRAPDIALFTQDLVDLGNNIKVLSVHAMTLHSAVHLFFQEEFHHAFRDLSDLDCMFTEFGELQGFWQNIQDLAVNTGFARELALACRYCSFVFNSPIPPDVLAQNQQYLPVKPWLALHDWMYLKVLQPQHALCGIKFRGLANFLALTKGHLIKMPLHVLVRHTLSKFYRTILASLLGEAKSKKS